MARHAIFVAPFGELCDARLVAELAARTEANGWDGFFVWDHVEYSAPVREVADPWVTLTAVALATERVTIGTLVTPIPRRRPHQLARETVTLDRLSGGRLVLGIGIGSDQTGEFNPERFGEEGDARVRGRMLDEGLERLLAYWDGEFEPRPAQRPRIPIWAAATWPNRKPLRRAARFEGLFPVDLPGPEAMAEMAAEVRELRDSDDPYELVVTNPPEVDTGPWIEAGATWCLRGFGMDPKRAEVERAIDAGPAG
jgi:alkanesulfonate monooxygenase SsuD/methylene tetrahydromethanopterin reductase-like flavin-dependent oxidoreductase (luciferase family)